jgi:hypothetical protein
MSENKSRADLDLLDIAEALDQTRAAIKMVLGIAKRQVTAARDRLDAPQQPEGGDEGPTPAQIAQRERFDRLYSDWHTTARAALCNPDLPEDDASAKARARRLDEVERAFLTTLASVPGGVFQKWEVLDQLMIDEAESGANNDNRVIVAVAAIKADVLRFGLGDNGLYVNA